ncbi:MAG: VCBS repeat-containing protein [Anaerolineales bacterium]|nr:VCBS repeat-containing protein [Anaerolineales bacterium]
MKRHFLLLAVLLFSLLPALPAHSAEPAAASPWPLTLKWQRCPNWYCETGWYASPAVGDLDADGAAEVYWGGYTLMAVNGTSGTIKWIRPQGSSARLWPGIVLADINNDTRLEVVTASGDGELAVYGPGLNPISPWPKNPTGDGREIRSLATADMDNDHDLEIAICSTRSDNQWFVYEHDGTVRSGWPQLSPDGDTNGYASGCFNENVAVADVDGDGSAEVIGPNDTHYVAAFHADGSPLRANPVYGLINGVRKAWARVGLHVDHAVDLRGYADCGVEHRPNMANSAPTIADVNGDGKLEIIIVGNIYNCGANPYQDLYEMPYILNADRTRWKDATHDWTVIPTPMRMRRH